MDLDEESLLTRHAQKMVHANKQAQQALVEHFEREVKKEGFRGLWRGHLPIYIFARGRLMDVLSGSVVRPFCVYPSYEDFEFDALDDRLTITPITRSRPPQAVVVTNNCSARDGQVWVKASFTGYRRAMLKYMKSLHPPPQPDLHQTAVETLDRVIAGVSAKELRGELNDTDRTSLLKHLGACLKKNRDAVAQGQVDTKLLEMFDCALDADHVYSSAAVKQNLDDAWIWVFPVPASANRAYGRAFERHYVQLRADAGTKSISAEILFKLYAGFIPENSDELAAALMSVASVFDPEVRMLYMRRMEKITGEILRVKPAAAWEEYKVKLQDYPSWTG